MKASRIRSIAAISFGLAGLACIVHASGWLLSLGVFLLLWGNNIGTYRTDE